MRAFTIPARYAAFLRSAIATAISEAQHDAAARATGSDAGRLPDQLIDAELEGDVLIALIDVPTDEQQLRDEKWPDKPREDEIRFPLARTQHGARRAG